MDTQRTLDSLLLGCSLCHRSMERGEIVYEEQVGWAAKRKKGGTNALVARRKTGRIACTQCVNRARRGVAEGQMAIQ